MSILLAAPLLLAQPAQDSAHFSFEDIAPSSGVKFVLVNSASATKHQIETMPSGVALFDYNNDGWLDIFFVNGASVPGLKKEGPQHFNRLYRNNKDGTFTDVTEKAGVSGLGYGMGAAAADYDNDGDEDLYVTGVNSNQLLRNNGDGTFSDVTAKAGVEGILPTYGKTWAISAGWFDYNNDGNLDLFVTNYVEWDPAHEPDCRVNEIRTYCMPEYYKELPNFLYRNNGDGTFTDVSAESGIGRTAGKGMGVAFADYDGDGYTDIFVANDSYRCLFFHNNGDGKFSEMGIFLGVAYNRNGRSIAGMGVDFRDVDNDGKPDLFVSAMVNDTFQLFRNAGKLFDDVTIRSGVARATLRMTAWSNGIFDFDNDGWKDLFAAGGSILDNSWEVQRLPEKLPNLLLRNENATFKDYSAAAGDGFKAPRMHRGAAFGDLNNDGRVDIVTDSLNDRAEVLINNSSPSNHWLILKLTGSKSNRDGIGARIRITPESGPPQFNHVTTSVGFAGSSDRRVHFGLGQARLVKEVEVLWPSGQRQVLENIPGDQVVAVTEP